MIIAVIPVDTTGLPDTGVVPKPTIQHTLINCPCGRQSWIGPTQLDTHRRTGIPVACYFCVMEIMRRQVDAHGEITVIPLNPDADSIPRRT
jgi:hypothetical protein